MANATERQEESEIHKIFAELNSARNSEGQVGSGQINKQKKKKSRKDVTVILCEPVYFSWNKRHSSSNTMHITSAPVV